MDWFGLEEESEEQELNKVKTVSEISAIIRNSLDVDALHGIWIEGEITNFRHHASGHLYFSLAESVSGRDYLINCAMWRSCAAEIDFKPESGMHVHAYGSVEVYEPHGKYQFIIREMRAAGEGDIHLLVAKWKKQLAEEGYFDEAAKKRLPQYPKKIGVVTSPTGAARRDIENVISRRYPVEIVLSPASVQGEAASREIAEALRRIDGLVDVIIVGRGGGSFEDLFPFNHPEVVKAVYSCRSPVVSAVGHEIDFTLTDLAADVRAPTPSAAAEIAVPDKNELLLRLRAHRERLNDSVCDRIRKEREALDHFTIMLHPRRFEKALNDEFQRLEDLSGRINRSMAGLLERERMGMDFLKASLYASDPEKNLERGYCIVKKDGIPVKSVSELSVNDNIEITMKDGECAALIKGVDYGKDIRRTG